MFFFLLDYSSLCEQYVLSNCSTKKPGKKPELLSHWSIIFIKIIVFFSLHVDLVAFKPCSNKVIKNIVRYKVFSWVNILFLLD